MANYATYADLLADVLDRAGEDTGGTSDFSAAAGRMLVRAAYELYNAHPFLFLRKYPPGALVTVAPLSTGTVAVTGGATGITFSAAPAVSVQGRKILVSGHPEVFRIAAHLAADPAASLDVAYTGPDNPAASYTVFQDEYRLAADVRHVVALAPAEKGPPLAQRSEEWLRENYADPPAAVWPPRFFARISEDRIRFEGYPSKASRMEYAYTIVGEDIDTGSLYVPANWRFVLADGALFHVLDMKDDGRSRDAAALFAGGVDKLIEDDVRKRQALHGSGQAAGSYA